MLKIKCLENNINCKKVYIGYITYKDLVKFAFLKPLTVNRITDETRIKKMKEYISKRDSNYPPIVVSVEEKCKVIYNGNELQIDKNNSNSNDVSKRLVIIDGQHRYLSIKELISDNENNNDILDRKQGIYILTNMSELEQRRYFMEINDNMKKVSTVSKRIFEISVANYISLKTMYDLELINKINIKNDQCTSNYPYKFIQSANKILFSNVDYEQLNQERFIDELNNYSKKSCIIWKEILRFIEENTKLVIGISTLSNKSEVEYKSIKTEIFIKCFISEFKNRYRELEDIKNLSNKKTQKIIKEYIEYVFNEINYFYYDDEINKLDRTAKEEKIKSILDGSKIDE